LTVGLILMRQIAPDARLEDVGGAWRYAGSVSASSSHLTFARSSPPHHEIAAAWPADDVDARLIGQTIGGVTVAMIFGFTTRHHDGSRLALSTAAIASAAAVS